MRVVFLGTPDFACPILEALHEAPEVDVVLVISQPDRRRSRGRVTPTPVKERALELGLDVVTPDAVNAPEVLDRLRHLDPDFLVVVAYGQLIGSSILDAFPDRILNVHASLLPAYRGAAPIERALMSGAESTGVSIMQIVRALDAGDVLAAVEVPMDDVMTIGALKEEMAEVGANLLLETLEHFDERNARRFPQDDGAATYAEKLSAEDAALDFRRPARLLVRQVHALADSTGTKFTRGTDRIRVHEAHVEESSTRAPAGTVVRADKTGIAVATSNGLFVIDRLQAPNRKALATRDFLNGYPIKEGERLSSDAMEA